MNYNRNYRQCDIDDYLSKVIRCIDEDRVAFSLREENIDFDNEYNLTDKKKKRLLKKIRTTDFCGTLESTNLNYAGHILYVFAPDYELFDADGMSYLVTVYVKMDTVITKSSQERTIVVSFHKLNYPISYVFR